MAALRHEREELATLAQPPPHHLAVAKHVAQNPQNRSGPQVEGAVEPLQGFVHLLAGEVLVAQHGLLNAVLFDKAGRMIGRATSGYYGHCLKKSLAIGYARTEFAAPGTELSIEILGERKPAIVVPESPYDPENLELRA